MNTVPTHLPSLAAINLRRLLALRVITQCGLALTLWVVVTQLGMTLPVTTLVGILAGMLVLSVVTLWRMRRLWVVRDGELFSQLLLDVAALTALFYFSGGSSNPFVMLYLLPLAIAAVALPAGYVWAMAVITAVSYSALLLWYQPLAHVAHTRDAEFGMHVFGMWLGFMLSAALIAWFAVRMSATVRERDHTLATLRENALRHERVLALGTLATGAAHELGTPLSTMAVLVKDIEPGHGVSAEKLGILRDQIRRCKEIIASLSAVAGQVRAESGQRQALDVWMHELLERWRVSRPGVQVQLRIGTDTPAPSIVAETTLAQAITNILNNAADASPDSVEIDARWSQETLVLEIADRGAGLAPEVQASPGEPFLTTKSDGLGLGLFLAYTTFSRFGGDVRLLQRDGGGVLCRLTLPLAELSVTGHER